MDKSKTDLESPSMFGTFFYPVLFPGCFLSSAVLQNVGWKRILNPEFKVIAGCAFKKSWTHVFFV